MTLTRSHEGTVSEWYYNYDTKQPPPPLNLIFIIFIKTKVENTLQIPTH